MPINSIKILGRIVKIVKLLCTSANLSTWNFNKPKKFDLNRKIKTITIDTTLYESELCYFGKEFDSDKSPLNFKSKSRHSYTGVYNLLFSGFKNNQVKIAEFGVLGNASIKMWSSFFHNVEIFAFDNDINFVSSLISVEYITSYSLSSSWVNSFDLILSSDDFWLSNNLQYSSIVKSLL